MDLTIDIGDYRLNVRAAAFIIKKNKDLTHRNINKDHYCIPGGRIEIGESSEETVKREIQEELGKKIKIEKYLTTIENFFELEGKKYHEIYFLYKAEFENEEDKKIDYKMQNKEGKDYLQYHWLDLDKIDEYNILPNCIKQVLKSNEIPRHIINKDK